MRKLGLMLLIVLQVFIIWGIYDSVKMVDLAGGFDLLEIFNGNWGNGLNIGNVKYREPFTASFAAGNSISLQNFVGDLEIEYGDVSEITFEGEKVLSNSNVDMEAFNNTIIEENRQGDKLILTWVKPRMFNGTIAFNGKVIVPKSTTLLRVEVSLGKVTSIGGTGNLEINANLGDVRIEDHTGSINVDADLGAVRVTNARPGDNLRIRADLGEVRYRGSLALNTDIRASLGSVTLTLPEDTLTHVDASVDLGSLDCDFPLTSYSNKGLGTTVNGILGDQSLGTPKGNLIIRADLGSVDINKAVIW